MADRMTQARKVLVCADTVVDGVMVGRNIIKVCDSFDAAEAYRKSHSHTVNVQLMYAAMTLLHPGKELGVNVSLAWERAF